MMQRGGGTILTLAMPAKVLVQRFAYVLLLAAAFSLLVLGRAESLFVERVRMNVADGFRPVLDAMSHPIASFNMVVDDVSSLFVLHSENARLREENERLRKWQDVARRLEQENAALKGLVSYVPDPQMTFISGRVIGDSGGSFVRTMLINSGAAHGVAKGQAVDTNDGLVGRIVEVGETSSRLLLLTDLNSRIPVLVERTRDRAIVAGDNSDRPRLVFLPASAEVEAGDRVVTSGHGGVFPPGLAVGRIVSAAENDVRVAPFVDLNRLEFVRILEFLRDEDGPAPLVAATE